jgi:FMN phosphatase YigB (HAD superfamily)
VTNVRAIVVDFDGTFTDVEIEGAPFQAAYRAALADLVGSPIEAEWEAALAELRRAPERYGWMHGGKIVAPGNADPYVRSTSAAQQIFDQRRLLKDPEVRTAVVQAFYAHAYRKTVTAFRTDARATLETLLASGRPVFVVTNSHTDVVEAKLRDLAPTGLHDLKVLGDAKKYIVCEPPLPDERFSKVPQTVQLAGLPRQSWPRRGHYFETLAKIWRDTVATPETTLVVGDIYELDLLLPAELGAQVHLVTGPATAPYERAAIEALGPRAALSERVGDVVHRIGLPAA